MSPALVGSLPVVKTLPAMLETRVQSLGREDPLEKEMATHSSILAWKIPWTEELGGLQSTGLKESDTTERLHFHKVYIWNLERWPLLINTGGAPMKFSHAGKAA